MKNRAFMMAVLGIAAMAIAAGTNNAADDDVPTIKEVMQKVNGKEGLKGVIAKDLKEKTVNWEEVKAHSEALTKLAEAMGKSKPPKGEEKAWAKVAEGYFKAAKSIDDAVEKKDTKAVLAAHGKMFAGNTCGACHKEFKK